MPARKRWFWAAIVVQLVLVLGIVGWREVALAVGQEVVLRTVPVDPRDAFRGDYVVLRYEISTIRSCYVRSGDIYVRLREAGGAWGLASWSSDYGDALGGDPDTYRVIRGRVTRNTGNTCNVEYGIESYFVPEGTGRDIERALRDLKVVVAVDELGAASIKRLILPP